MRRDQLAPGCLYLGKPSGGGVVPMMLVYIVHDVPQVNVQRRYQETKAMVIGCGMIFRWTDHTSRAHDGIELICEAP